MCEKCDLALELAVVCAAKIQEQAEEIVRIKSWMEKQDPSIKQYQEYKEKRIRTLSQNPV